MTLEKFDEIMHDETIDPKWEGDNTLQGLNLMASYLPDEKYVVAGADHDIVYSVDAQALVDAGITEEDAIKLRMLNWMMQDEYLACFV